ncbi:MAG: methionine--tRNA ligase [Anaerolineae bacterium]|nr:methionine--tRNA ligase [Anaerolineae bacterium]
MTAENILVCVAWPYANGDLHVGHVAGAYLPADIFARYQRLKGNRVVMVSGSDAHGTPIVVRADKEGKTPREVFEYFHSRFLETQQLLGISYDLFTHTDTENHHAIGQQMFRRLLANEYLFKATQKQLYSETQGKFLPDRLVEGTCPICGYDKARGDQCDNCGNLLDGTQLINPRSRNNPDDKLTVRESEHYFFDLPALREPVLAYLADKDGYWRPTVLEFSRRYAEEMEARAFTRDLTWGIPIPVQGAEGKCIYVWYEALLGYLSATVEWAKITGQPDAWKEFWYQPDNVRIYNFIGKDNILFHTVLWQAVLIGMQRLGEPWDGLDDSPQNRGPKFNLPYDVPANQYLNLGGQKFSKSLGVSLDAIDLAQKYGADPLRFYLSLIMPETKDSDWSWTDFAQRNNSELLAKWGNLIQRTLSQIWRNFEGRIPQPGELTGADQAIIARAEAAFNSVGEKLNAVRLRDALNEVLELATATNQYLDFEAPWKAIKTDRARAGTQLYVAARVIDSLTVLFAPFTPGLSEKARAQLGYTDPLFGEQYIETLQERGRSHDVLRYDASRAKGEWKPSRLTPGQPLGGEPKGLVSKIEVN